MSTQPVAPGWTADDATFGARLALIRQRRHWGNIKEAAMACQIATETWRSWERDEVEPQRYLEVCQQISYHSGCDYGWLVDRRPSGGSWATPPADTPSRLSESNRRPIHYNSIKRQRALVGSAA